MFLLTDSAWKADELNAIAAIASATTAFIALGVAALTAYYQRKALHSAWLSNSASVVKSFSERWVAPDMRSHRKSFAQHLLNGDQFDIALSCPVLEFFEDLGYITRRGVVDQTMVWNSFSFSIPRYYLFLTHPHNRLKEARKKHGSEAIYREFEWLFEMVSKIDAKENNHPQYQPPNLDLIREFLHDEANLPGTIAHKESTQRRTSRRRSRPGRMTAFLDMKPRHRPRLLS